MPAYEIPDDEVVLRRIPATTPWLAEGPRVTSANFAPKPGENGISVSRLSLTSPDRLLALAPHPAAFRIAALSVREIRGLGLDVSADPTPDDPGHCEIRPAEALRNSHSLRRKLARACDLLP